MGPEERIKLFGLNNLAIEAALQEVGRKLGRPLSSRQSEDKDPTYYPQFPEGIRDEAASMARHYEIFYCLENSIRQLIADRLRAEAGDQWWSLRVPEFVRKNAEANQKREIGTGMTPRSAEMIAYTTFGELGEIVKTNWDLFGDTFRDMNAVQNVLSRLNSLRAPIAHCCALAEDEVLRLQLSVRDWFRQMS